MRLCRGSEPFCTKEKSTSAEPRSFRSFGFFANAKQKGSHLKMRCGVGELSVGVHCAFTKRSKEEFASDHFGSRSDNLEHTLAGGEPCLLMQYIYIHI